MISAVLIRGGATRHGMAGAGRGSGAGGMLRVFCHRLARPLRLSDDDTQTISTFVYAGALQKRGANEFNRQLLKECRQLRHDDAAGRRWSAENYPGGYTSYGSCIGYSAFRRPSRPCKQAGAHVKAFADAVEWISRAQLN